MTDYSDFAPSTTSTVLDIHPHLQKNNANELIGLTSLVHQALFDGLELIVMAKYNLRSFCSHIQEYKITVAYVVPPVLLQLSNDALEANFDLSSMSSGAAPLTKELVDAVYQRIRIPVK